MGLKKNASLFAICISTIFMYTACDKYIENSIPLKFHSIYLDFITPTGENLLKEISFVGDKPLYSAQEHLCDDRISLQCTRTSDGKTAVFTDKDNPALPYDDYRISYPSIFNAKSSFDPTIKDSRYVLWKIGPMISFVLEDYESQFGKKKISNECYNIQIISKAIYDNEQPHYLHIYVTFPNGLPKINCIKYDDSDTNLMDQDVYIKISREIGYRSGYEHTESRAFIPIVVDRK